MNVAIVSCRRQRGHFISRGLEKDSKPS